jgi:P27 family predicted phage terminase small subunit
MGRGMTKRPKLHTPVTILTSLPDCPIDLDDVGRAEWDRYGPILIKAGRLTEESAPAFALYCDTWSAYLRNAEDVRVKGSTLLSDTKYGKVVKPNPAAAAANANLAVLLRISNEFGITPGAKRRVGPVETPTVDAVEDFNREFA